MTINISFSKEDIGVYNHPRMSRCNNCCFMWLRKDIGPYVPLNEPCPNCDQPARKTTAWMVPSAKRMSRAVMRFENWLIIKRIGAKAWIRENLTRKKT